MKATGKISLAVIATAVFLASGTAQGTWESEGVELQRGESQVLGEFKLVYDDTGTEPSLELLKGDKTPEEDEGLENITILTQYDEEDILDAPGEISYRSEKKGIGFEVLQAGFDNGFQLELEVDSRRDIFSDSELSTSAPDRLIGRRGESIDVPLVLENEGVAEETYQLTTENETRLEVEYGFDSFNISEIELEAGEKQNLKSTVTIPETARKGLNELTLVADGGQQFTETVSVEVRGEEKNRELGVDIRESFKSIKPGEEIKIPVTVENTGDTELEDINVSVDLNEGWSVSVRPSQVDSLEPRYGRERITVSITPPAGVEKGDYFADVSASNSKVGVEEPERVRINVVEKSGLAGIGLAVMALSLLLLIVVQRRFKRR